MVERFATGLVMVCGDSGEGFKVSALMGEVLADLAEGCAADHDVTALSRGGSPTAYPAAQGPMFLAVTD